MNKKEDKQILLFGLVVVIIAIGSMFLSSGSDVPLNPVQPVKTDTNVGGLAFYPGDAIPQSYAPPWDVFNDNEMIFTFKPETIDVQNIDPDDLYDLEIVVDHEGGVIYEIGYIYFPEWGQWESIGFDGERISGTNWLKDYGEFTILDWEGEELRELGEELGAGEHYVLSYSCKKHDDQWKCGCVGEDDCGYWMIQSFDVIYDEPTVCEPGTNFCADNKIIYCDDYSNEIEVLECPEFHYCDNETINCVSTLPPEPAFCGNGWCEEGENSDSCIKDCPKLDMNAYIHPWVVVLEEEKNRVYSDVHLRNFMDENIYNITIGMYIPTLSLETEELIDVFEPSPRENYYYQPTSKPELEIPLDTPTDTYDVMVIAVGVTETGEVIQTNISRDIGITQPGDITCEDRFGEDYYERQYVSEEAQIGDQRWGFGQYSDTCCSGSDCDNISRYSGAFKGDNLIEYVCENNRAKPKIIYCEHGCEGGECIIPLVCGNGVCQLGEEIDIWFNYTQPVKFREESYEIFFAAANAEETEITLIVGEDEATFKSGEAKIVGGLEIYVDYIFTSNRGGFSASASIYYGGETISCPQDCGGTICEDSDGGIDYDVKGYTSTCTYNNQGGGCGGTSDSCNGNLLTELYCEGTSMESTTYTCPNGCDEGACVLESGCSIIERDPTNDKYWQNLGLDTSAHPEIKRYKIQWYSGAWSDWYTTGVDDVDWKTNYDGTQRRVWSYFGDHNHMYEECLSDGPDLLITEVYYTGSERKNENTGASEYFDKARVGNNYVTYQVNIKNVGNQDVYFNSDTVVIRATNNDGFVGSIGPSAKTSEGYPLVIEVGEERNYRFTSEQYPALLQTAGEKEIIFEVNPDNYVQEGNEGNNDYTESLTVYNEGDCIDLDGGLNLYARSVAEGYKYDDSEEIGRAFDQCAEKRYEGGVFVGWDYIASHTECRGNDCGVSEAFCHLIPPDNAKTIATKEEYECEFGCLWGACYHQKISDYSINKDILMPNENISIVAETLEVDGTVAERNEGWHVQFEIYEVGNDNRIWEYYVIQEGYYNAGYNYQTKQWDIKFPAPLEPGNYYVELDVYCSQMYSKCWNITNGNGNQWKETIYFDVVETVELTCKDTDGEKNYFKSGSTKSCPLSGNKASCQLFFDACEDGTRAIENSLFVEINNPIDIDFGGSTYEIDIVGANFNAETIILSINGIAKELEQGETKTIGKLEVYIEDVSVTQIPELHASANIVIGRDIENVLAEGSCENGGGINVEYVECELGCDKGACIEAPVCHDSDGGRNYFEKGAYGNREDFCLNNLHDGNIVSQSGLLKEVIRCDPYDYTDYDNVYCNCVDGACTENSTCGDGLCNVDESVVLCPEDCELRCEETDDGEDYYNKGITSGFFKRINLASLEDYCIKDPSPKWETPWNLVEYYCEGTNLETNFYECEFGCEDGACLERPQCPDVECPLDCSLGCTFDENGCTTGQCIEPSCENHPGPCPDGKDPINTGTDNDGCTIWSCLSVGPTCPLEYDCPSECTNGCTMDDTTCNITCVEPECQNAPPPGECPGGFDHYNAGVGDDGCIIWECPALPESCLDILQRDEFSTNNPHIIYPYGDENNPVEVYCNMEDGGWTRLNTDVADTAIVDFNSNDEFVTNNIPGKPCNTYGDLFKVIETSVPFTQVRVEFERSTSIVQCPRIALWKGQTSYYLENNDWIEHATCVNNDRPWSNTDARDMEGLASTWRLEGKHSGEDNVILFQTTCTANNDDGEIIATAWVK
ncbi:MAG: hypothetical protein ABH828_04040 [archaeon]